MDKKMNQNGLSYKSMVLNDAHKKLSKDFYHPNGAQARAIKSIVNKDPQIPNQPVSWFEKANEGRFEQEAKSLTSGLTANPQEQDKLAKSLTTGYEVNPTQQEDGAATRVQSLDPRIKNLTYGENDFTLYPKLIQNGIVNANSTVEQYVVFLKHGQIGHSLFQHEIGITDISQPHLRQKTVKMKFLTATRQESFAAQLVNSVEDADRINELDAITTMGKTIEWALFYGDSKLTAHKGDEGVEFDGLLNLTDQRNIMNANGHSLTPELLNRSAVLIARGFGTPTDAYMPVSVKADFNNQFLGAQRIMMPTRRGYTAGTDIDRFISVRGQIALHGSTVMDLDNILDEDTEVRPSAPAKPVIASMTKLSEGQLDSKMDNKAFVGNFNFDRIDNGVSGDTVRGELGAPQGAKNDNTKPANLSYKVVACSTRGDSLPSDAKTLKDFNIDASSLKSTDSIDIGVQLSGRRLPNYVAIYRQGLVHGDYWLIARVAVKHMNPTDNTIHFVDTNARIPETGDVFVGEIRPTTIGLMQLLPMTRLNLAQVTDASSFSILWYGALAVYIPRRFAVIRNVRYNEFSSLSENHLEGINSLGYSPVDGTGNHPGAGASIN